MPATIYEKLFSRLADLIAFENAPEGSVFCATPRLVGDLAVYCHVSAAEGSMRIIEMADDNPKTGALPRPWLKIRVDVSNHIAEVLEVEDAFGYQIVYSAPMQINPRRPQINMFALNWLYMLAKFRTSEQHLETSPAAI